MTAPDVAIDAFDLAAGAIVAAYAAGRQIPRLDPALRPADLGAAYEIQDRVAAARGPIGGWKVGRNPVDEIDTCAPLLKFRILAGGGIPAPHTLMGTGLEIEFAFRVGTDLPRRAQPYAIEEVRAAVDGFVPLVELVGGRFAERESLSVAEQLADGFGAAVITGERVALWQELDFRGLRAELWIDGARAQVARGCHPAGDPLILVTWLANHLAARPAAGGLRRGQIVTTGGLAGVTSVVGGERVEARYVAADDREIARVDFEFMAAPD